MAEFDTIIKDGMIIDVPASRAIGPMSGSRLGKSPK